MIHSNFKLNNNSFTSLEVLKEHALKLSKEGTVEEKAVGQFIEEWIDEKDFIEVKTSGSTGNPKSITLYKSNVLNSAKATIDYFKLFENTKALLCLPAKYIAGKMMLVRAMVAGWDLHMVSPGKEPLKSINEVFDFTAMVPYQVFHSLEDLHKVKKVIIGGGAIPSKLEQELQQIDTEAFATYGMTETISHIAVRRVNGEKSSTVFSALPLVSFSQTQLGCLKINAKTISSEVQVTNDVVELISPTSFKFLGRLDNVINSGGVKIFSEVVERKLSHYIKQPFFVSSEKDDALGERIILIVESEKPLQLSDFTIAFESLSPYERPKKLLVTPKFLYTDTEKIKRFEILSELLRG